MGAVVLEPVTGDRSAWFPPSVLEILASPDVVEVLSVDPRQPHEDGDDEDDEDTVRPLPSGPGWIGGYSVRGTARVPTPARREAVGRALVAANREGDGAALCFDPHFGVRATRGDRTAEFLICFLCGNVRVVGPGSHADTYAIGPSAARLLRQELRRGGVGWLWFWRRWPG